MSFSNTEKEIVARKRTQSPERSGITVAAAKYASEDGATLVNYTIAIVEYTRLCGPLKAALEKQNELIREIEENERVQKEKDEQVGNNGLWKLRKEKRKKGSPNPQEITYNSKSLQLALEKNLFCSGSHIWLPLYGRERLRGEGGDDVL